MKAFGALHPLVLFCYFIAVLFLSAFTSHPVLLALSLLGAVCFWATLEQGGGFWRSMGYYAVLFLLIAVTNPLFSHNGVTPLFFLNGNPVTLEAILMGIDIAALMVSIIFWCKCYSLVMTSDKFLYLFGRIVPKLSLVLSMALRFIPLFQNQAQRVGRAQKAMGLYAGTSYVDKLRGGLRVFSVMVTWSLENAVDTGDSMRARGYGLKGRTSFSLFRFALRDGVFLAGTAILLAAVLAGMRMGYLHFTFYPEVAPVQTALAAIWCYVCYGLLAFLPFILETEENLKWIYSVSKI